MNMNDYQVMAARTINHNLSASEQLLNGCMGLCGESGECIDILKKHLAQGHPLDVEHIIDELGDVVWYASEVAYALGVGLDEVCERNIAKLSKRYPTGFEVERSINREE